MIRLLPSKKGDGTCTFCTSKECAENRINSRHPDRRLVVFVCETCTEQLTKALVDALCKRE